MPKRILSLDLGGTRIRAACLDEQLNMLKREETLTLAIEKEVGDSRLTSELADTPVESLDLSVRVFNSLKRTGITTVGDVLDLLEKGESAVMSIRNFGEKSLDELRQKMREMGYMKDETSSVE